MSGAWFAGLGAAADAWAAAICRAAWQGGLALLLAWGVCRALPRMAPDVRCWLWRLAFLKLLVALFCLTPVPLPVLPAPLSLESPVSSGPRPPASSPEAVLSSRAASTASAALPSDPATAVAEPPDAAMIWALLLWVLGVGICGMGILRDWREGRRLVHVAVPITDASLCSASASLARRLGLRSPPRLLQSEEIDSSLLLGMRRPAILMPSPLLGQRPRSELSLMLAHELAHLQRRDLLWCWLPTAARAVFFFHPLVWLAQQEWHLAQEMACDATALRITHAPATAYGEMLLRVAGRSRGAPRRGAAILGILESARTLARRLNAMKHLDRHQPSSPARSGVTLAVLGLAVIVPWRLTAQAAVTPRRENAVQTRKPATSVSYSPRRGDMGIGLPLNMKDPGQPDPRGLTLREPFVMVRVPAIQQELRLTPEQRERLKPAMARWEEYVGRMHSTVRGLRRAQEAHAGFRQQAQAALSADQQRRLEQISRQGWYPSALFREDVARDLALTPEQREQLQAIVRAFEQSVRGLAVHVQLAHQQSIETAPGKWSEWEGQSFQLLLIPAKAAPKLREAEMEASNRALALLTDDQRRRWQELLGAPYPPARRKPEGGAIPRSMPLFPTQPRVSGLSSGGSTSFNLQPSGRRTSALWLPREALFLLPFPSVKEDLKLAGPQEKRLQAVLRAWGIRRRLLTSRLPYDPRKVASVDAQARRQVALLLTAAQEQRLGEIGLRVAWVEAFLRPDVAERLGLTTEQRRRIRAIGDTQVVAGRDLMQRASEHPGNAHFVPVLVRLRRLAYDQCLVVLTGAQRGAWQRLIGSPFTLKAIITSPVCGNPACTLHVADEHARLEAAKMDGAAGPTHGE